MRCPKCHYISFEDADRCRNCGYDFSLATALAQVPTELALNDRDGDPLPPMDLSLSAHEFIEATPKPTPTPIDLGAIDEGPEGGTSTPIDLPLFKGSSPARRPSTDPVDDDVPLVKPRAVPRAPIAVRRGTPDAARMRSRYPIAEVPKLALEPPDAVELAEFASEADIDLRAGKAADSGPSVTPAPAWRRMLAALIDLAIVLGIDGGVLYFTLKLCDLPLDAAGLLALPLVPVTVFLVMLDAGYTITFTAAVGQTIGKMATGLKVVHVNEDDRLDGQPNFGFAILRTAAYAASLLPAGLGFLPALVGKDRRALHDRLAETRVIYWG